MNVFIRFKNWYKGLPDKKKYLEVITAALSIPVLLTVIISNVGNIQERNKKDPVDDAKTEKEVITLVPIEVTKEIDPTEKPEPSQSPQITQTQECIDKVGPIELVSPLEDEVITDDPLCLQIEQQSDKYCSLIWSYKLDDDPWSEYTDKQTCLYNLENGKKKLQLKIKSSTSDEEKIISRNFEVKNITDESNTPTPTQISPAVNE